GTGPVMRLQVRARGQHAGQGRQAGVGQGDTAAAIYLPLRDKLYAASRGAGTTLNGARVTLADTGLSPLARVLAARPNLQPHHWSGAVPEIDRHYRPSLAYRLSLVSEGKFDGMLTLRPSWEWDIAAGALLVSEAGGSISDRTGSALRFNNPTPKLNGVVAAAPRLHRDLVARLA
ncbi:MAG: inositol monophosphatase family protein, partial [Pseudomonadota bacterium]